MRVCMCVCGCAQNISTHTHKHTHIYYFNICISCEYSMNKMNAYSCKVECKFYKKRDFTSARINKRSFPLKVAKTLLQSFSVNQ